MEVKDEKPRLFQKSRLKRVLKHLGCLVAVASSIQLTVWMWLLLFFKRVLLYEPSLPGISLEIFVFTVGTVSYLAWYYGSLIRKRRID